MWTFTYNSDSNENLNSGVITASQGGYSFSKRVDMNTVDLDAVIAEANAGLAIYQSKLDYEAGVVAQLNAKVA